MAATYITSIDEAKLELGIDGTGNDVLLGKIVNRSRARIEAYLNRLVVTRSSDLTEYHTMRGSSELYTLDSPIISITTIHEDATRVYGASSLLVEGTDYLLVKPIGRIVRLNGGYPTRWEVGFHAIKIVGSFGYASTAAVPWALKDPALRHVARTYREITKEVHDVHSIADDVGRVQYFSDRTFNKSITQDLDPYRYVLVGDGSTGERVDVVPDA